MDFIATIAGRELYRMWAERGAYGKRLAFPLVAGVIVLWGHYYSSEKRITTMGLSLFTGLGHLGGGTSKAYGLSQDGTVVVGDSLDANGKVRDFAGCGIAMPYPVETVYQYVHPDMGKVEMLVLRMVKPDGDKEFKQARPEGSGFVREAPPKPWPLYNRARVRNADTIVVVEGEKDYGIRFYGIPMGYEFMSLVEAISAASKGESGLSQKTKEKLQNLKKPVHIQVFVSPTCPDSAKSALQACQFAIESDNVRTDVISITEFPHLAVKHGVRGVPKTVANERLAAEGAISEGPFLRSIMSALK